MYSHIKTLTAKLVSILQNKGTQEEFTKAYTDYCGSLGIDAKHNGRNRFTQFEQGQLSGSYHGFMAGIQTVFAYEFNGNLYTTNKNVPNGFHSTSELHALDLTQEQWGALPNGIYHLTGEVFFKQN